MPPMTTRAEALRLDELEDEPRMGGGHVRNPAALALHLGSAALTLWRAEEDNSRT
jgi:hypothetical protein